MRLKEDNLFCCYLIMTKEMEIKVIPNEGSKLEYKKVDNRDLAKVLVAFSNSKGGRIQIGISDDKSIVGTDATMEGIACIARDNCYPSINPEITKEEHGEKYIINVDVPIGEHPPYSNQGRYLVRISSTNDDANINELIDLIVKGPHKGTILLRVKLDDLKNSISASISSSTDTGTQHAIEGINQLNHLMKESLDESAKLDTINVFDFLIKQTYGFNDKIIQEIVFLLSITFSVYLAPNYKRYVPSEKIMTAVIDVLEDAFRTSTIVAEKTDLVIRILNALYKMSLGCFWAGYENQVLRINKIISEPIGRDRKLSKYLEKTLQKIEKCIIEENVFEPRRLGMLAERIED